MSFERDKRTTGDGNEVAGAPGAAGKRSRSESLPVQRQAAGTGVPVLASPASAAVAGSEDPFGMHLIEPSAAGGGGGGVVQRKETTTNVPLTETQDDANAQIATTIQSVFNTPYPEHRNYPEAPTQAYEVENRLRGYGALRGPTAEEKEWLYQCSMAIGLFRLGDQYRNRADAGKPINPARASVVSFALSQVGLVEAHTAAPDPDNPGKTARKGYPHLRQYYQETGRVIDEGVLHDASIKVGPEGGNKIGSWCQILSEWAVQHGGGTFHVAVGGSNQVKVPQPGDVAYMAQSQHMAVVVSVEGDEVTTVDGNMPPMSATFVCRRKLSAWDQGFHDSFPGT